MDKFLAFPAWHVLGPKESPEFESIPIYFVFNWPIHRICLVKPHKSVELFWKEGFRIMAPSLRVRPINDPDESFQPRILHQFALQFLIFALSQIQKETLHPRIVANSLDAARQRGENILGNYRILKKIKSE